MKTINLKLSKRLAPYLENVETEYGYAENKLGNMFIRINHTLEGPILYKTLTFEEAIEFIAKQTGRFIFIYKKSNIIKSSYLYAFMEILRDGNIGKCITSGDTYLKCIEEMIEYLLDNNLLGKQ